MQTGNRQMHKTRQDSRCPAPSATTKPEAGGHNDVSTIVNEHGGTVSDQKNTNATLHRTIVILGLFLLVVPGYTIACGDMADDEENSEQQQDNVTEPESDLDLVPPPGAEFDNTGSEVVDTVEGSWEYDHAHSNLRWETAYKGASARLAGHFDDVHIDMQFDQSDLENSWVRAEVVVSSIDTGNAIRDGLGGCVVESLGVSVVEEDGEYKVDDPDTDLATFESTNIEKDGDGYLIEGNFDFLGTESEVEMVAGYIPQTLYESERGDSMYAGFTGKFSFQALSVHGVDSDNINDTVTIIVDANIAGPLPE